MRKIIIASVFTVTLFLSGCLEVVQEATVNLDGSGTIASKIDMSAMMEMMMQMGMGKTDEKMEIDSVIPFAPLVDTISSFSAEEKALVKDASIHLEMSSSTGKFIIGVNAPFKKPEDIEKINQLVGKIDALEKTMKGAMGKNDQVGAMMGDQTIESTEEKQKGDFKLAIVDDYFKLTAEKGKFKRELIKEKYQELAENEIMQKMKEGMEQGMPGIKTVFVLNLPKPAKKVEGKVAVLSDDKRKVTIENTMDELFDDPSRFEFTIEY